MWIRILNANLMAYPELKAKSDVALLSIQLATGTESETPEITVKDTNQIIINVL